MIVRNVYEFYGGCLEHLTDSTDVSLNSGIRIRSDEETASPQIDFPIVETREIRGYQKKQLPEFLVDAKFPVKHSFGLNLAILSYQDEQNSIPRSSLKILCKIGRSLVLDQYKAQMPEAFSLVGVKPPRRTNESRTFERRDLQRNLPFSNHAVSQIRWQPKNLGSVLKSTCMKVNCVCQPCSFLDLTRHLRFGHYSLKKISRIPEEKSTPTSFYPVNLAKMKGRYANLSSCVECRLCGKFFNSGKALNSHYTILHPNETPRIAESRICDSCPYCEGSMEKGTCSFAVCQNVPDESLARCSSQSKSCPVERYDWTSRFNQSARNGHSSYNLTPIRPQYFDEFDWNHVPLSSSQETVDMEELLQNADMNDDFQSVDMAPECDVPLIKYENKRSMSRTKRSVKKSRNRNRTITKNAKPKALDQSLTRQLPIKRRRLQTSRSRQRRLNCPENLRNSKGPLTSTPIQRNRSQKRYNLRCSGRKTRKTL